MNKRHLAFATASLLGGLAFASSAVLAGDSCGDKKKGSGKGSYHSGVYAPAPASGYPEGYGFIKASMHEGSHGMDGSHGDIVDVAVAAGSFNTLVAAVKAAGLVDTLKGEGPYTVFAPTDAAFAKIPEDQLKALLADQGALVKVLTYHVVPGKLMAADVAEGASATTAEGSKLTITTKDGVKVDEARVVQTDIMASNGVIHVIDTVIMPD